MLSYTTLSSFLQVLGLANAGVMLPLPWSTRMKIALGAARGLAFLHEAERPVIYRDFKTSNILLDEVCKPCSTAPMIAIT